MKQKLNFFFFQRQIFKVNDAFESMNINKWGYLFSALCIKVLVIQTDKSERMSVFVVGTIWK